VNTGMLSYRLLGATGLRVSELCLGTMTFGQEGWGSDESQSRSIYSLFRDYGGNFVDTANEIYADGRSEELLGKFMRGHRDSMVLSTKYSDHPAAGDPNESGNQRKSMIRSVERSLTRLACDYIDIFWIHAWDFTSAPEEVMRALDDLVRGGKVLHIGVSNAPAWVIAACNTISRFRGWNQFCCLQIEYNLIERSAEIEAIPVANAFDMSVLAWSPLAMGVLSGRYGSDDVTDARLNQVKFKQLGRRELDAAGNVRKLAAEEGLSSIAVAIAWLLGRNIIPVVGARSPAQLKDTLEATSAQLSPGLIQRLNAVCPPPTIAPYNALQAGRDIIYGGYADRIFDRNGAPLNSFGVKDQ
jgi:aryl-alcohol dehydrogenase-like predicted oxidoreductase